MSLNLCYRDESGQKLAVLGKQEEVSKTQRISISIFVIFSDQKTPLHAACRAHNSEIAFELLKKHDIDVNKSDNQVNTKPKLVIYWFFLIFYFIQKQGKVSKLQRISILYFHDVFRSKRLLCIGYAI